METNGAQAFRAAQLTFYPVPQHSLTSLTANLSTQLFNSTFSSTESPFSYIIPYGQSQECNIFGPICQTGSITVGVNLTHATTSSVLPCSSYLKAQSQYILPETDNYMSLNYAPGPWLDYFGHSPECRSYARANWDGQYTFPECGNSSTVFQGYGNSGLPSQIPPGVQRYFSPEYTGFCCGNCSLDLSELRLYYFPDSTVTDCHSNKSFNNISVSSPGNLVKRVQSLAGDGSIAVVDGHTL